MATPRFTERDVQKAITGAQKAGLEIGSIEIDRRTGVIKIISAAAMMGGQPVEERDEMLEWCLSHPVEEWPNAPDPSPPSRRTRRRR